MTIKQKHEIKKMRAEGCSLKAISEKLEVALGTIKSYLSRKDSVQHCEQCEKSIQQKNKKKRFAPTAVAWSGGEHIVKNRKKLLHRAVRYVSRHLSHIQVSNRRTVPGSVQERQGGWVYRNVMMYQIMVEDALNGKIDLIATKSVSRFSRNTVDSLRTYDF